MCSFHRVMSCEVSIRPFAQTFVWWPSEFVVNSFQRQSEAALRISYKHKMPRRVMVPNLLACIGHSEIEQGTGASFKF